jgi:Protein of unknown function (DUF3999)
MRPFVALSVAIAAASSGSTPSDFAYRMQVTGTHDAAAYRVALPLEVYRKITQADLSDLRVFNARGEPVPFAIERPAAGTVSHAATALALFPLNDNSPATLDAIKITIESGKSAINVQAAGQSPPNGSINTYLVDGRALDVPVAALRLEWPQDAGDFAGRVRLEASDTLGDWRAVSNSAPIANLHSNGERLIEQRVEFSATKAKYWRLSWSGATAPFVLTSVLAEPARQNVDARHASLNVPAVAARRAAGEFEYDLGASLPVDRANLELPDANTVVDVELLSRKRPTDPWHIIRRCGFYRLKGGDAEELRNGPVPVALNTDRYWLVRTDPKGGGLGNTAPGLVVDWVPHEVVFVARGAGPFYVAYGSAAAESAAISLAGLPKNVSIESASLSDPQSLGGDSRLRHPVPYPWKTPLLWAILLVGAGLLAWMAWRLSKDFSRARKL